MKDITQSKRARKKEDFSWTTLDLQSLKRRWFLSLQMLHIGKVNMTFHMTSLDCPQALVSSNIEVTQQHDPRDSEWGENQMPYLASKLTVDEEVVYSLLTLFFFFFFFLWIIQILLRKNIHEKCTKET